MRYLKTYEAKINSNKHTIEEYIDNPDLIDSENKEWSTYRWSTKNSKSLELTYLGNDVNVSEKDIKDIYVLLQVKQHETFSKGYPFVKKIINNKNLFIKYSIGDNDIYSHGFSHSNIRNFDIYEFLDESIRYIENIIIFKILSNIEECYEYIFDNSIISVCNTFIDLKKFNEQVDILKDMYGYYIDGEDMGLL